MKRISKKFFFGWVLVFLSGGIVFANIFMLQGRMEGEGEIWKIIVAIILSVCFWANTLEE